MLPNKIRPEYLYLKIIIFLIIHKHLGKKSLQRFRVKCVYYISPHVFYIEG